MTQPEINLDFMLDESGEGYLLPIASPTLGDIKEMDKYAKEIQRTFDPNFSYSFDFKTNCIIISNKEIVAKILKLN